ncbi:hypothetical protein DN448_10680, partial [Lactobacillus reuteri]|nr:hypothetical protein [Limosilactobacillus reuteri]
CLRIALNFSLLVMFGFPKFFLFTFFILYNTDIKKERERNMVINEQEPLKLFCQLNQGYY